MAEIIERCDESTIKSQRTIPSNGKTNTALGLSIAGLSLALLGGPMANLFGWGGNNWNNGRNGGRDGRYDEQHFKEITEEEQYLERKQAQNYIDITKQYYEGKLQNQRELAQAFFDTYKRDVDNSFQLYKYTRDSNDATNQRIVDSSFQLYKNNRDSNDALNAKIAEVDKKVDVMAAIRPYQDALIDAKINQNALISDFNLSRRTCRMIEGQLVLPSTPVVSGYGSYSTCHCNTPVVNNG